MHFYEMHFSRSGLNAILLATQSKFTNMSFSHGGWNAFFGTAELHFCEMYLGRCGSNTIFFTAQSKFTKMSFSRGGWDAFYWRLNCILMKCTSAAAAQMQFFWRLKYNLEKYHSAAGQFLAAEINIWITYFRRCGWKAFLMAAESHF